jgi:hypothetical protein
VLTLENKLKKVAVCAAVDITLRGKDRSPERCARNLLELGESVTKHMDKAQRERAYEELLEVCRTGSFLECRCLFISMFLQENNTSLAEKK